MTLQNWDLTFAPISSCLMSKFLHRELNYILKDNRGLFIVGDIYAELALCHTNSPEGAQKL